MAKAKSTSKKDEGDELMIDDDDAPVATAPRRTPKEQTKKQKVGGRKTGPAASKAKSGAKAKAKAVPKASSNGKAARTKVEHKAPKAGSKFTVTYKGSKHTMTVKRVKDATVYVYKGKSHKSPSAAALAVVGRERGPNGWTFWGIEKVN